MATLTDLLSDLPRGLKPGGKVADFVVGRWDWEGGTAVFKESRAMQWFPESLSDNKAVDWEQKVVPGGSHPFYTFTGGGERTISVTVQFSCDHDPTFDSGVLDMGDGKPGRSTDIRAEIQYLRQFMYAAYSKSKGKRVTPPPMASLTISNLGWGCSGTGPANSKFAAEDTVYSLMTGCDVTYPRLFPSGHPRIAEVSLTFAEIVQYDRLVRFIGRNPDVGGFKSRKAIRVGG